MWKYFLRKINAAADYSFRIWTDCNIEELITRKPEQNAVYSMLLLIRYSFVSWGKIISFITAPHAACLHHFCILCLLPWPCINVFLLLQTAGKLTP